MQQWFKKNSLALNKLLTIALYCEASDPMNAVFF